MALMGVGVLCAQSRSDLALHLMSEGDYFRAISVYKELAFFSRNSDSTALYTYQIAKAYRLSKKYELSIRTLSELSAIPELNPSWSSKMNFQLGLNYLGMQVPAQAAVFFADGSKSDTTGLGTLFLGFIECENGRWDSARNYFSHVSHSAQRSDVRRTGQELLDMLRGEVHYARRSPVAAAVFSAVLPGSGQLYCGHYVDALQAFSFVATFSFVSYVAYRYESDRRGGYVLTGVSLSLTGIFHLANIFGAEKTAEFFNQRQRDLFLQPMREKSLSIDF